MKSIGPIIRDTSENSVSIVLYGTASNCYGFIQIYQPETDYSFILQETLLPEKDYAERFTFNDLTPYTLYYYYAITTNDPDPDAINWDNVKAYKFTTDNPEASKFKFVFGSCRYFLQVSNLFSIGSNISDIPFKSIHQLMKNGHDIRLFLEIGDQVYTDTTQSLPFIRNKSEKSLQALHLSARSTKGIKKIMSLIETKAIEDDHAYRDNGTPTIGLTEPDVYQNCCNAINIYDHPNGPFPKNSELKYGIEFKRGPCHFYLADTRYTRSNDHIMTEDEWNKLETWLIANPNQLKFLISPVSVFLQHSDDGWYGFPKDRYRLLKLIDDHSISNLFILSGDAHSSVSAQFSIYKNNIDTNKTVTEIISSGFYSIFHDSKKEFYNSVTCSDDDQDIEYIAKTTESLEELRDRVIQKNNFAFLTVDTTKNKVYISYLSAKGKLLQSLRYDITA